ncbi:MAG TPA: cation transporter [Candidatus Sulfotelmatobacter sp.]|nr:cation transporter [Candidatus Sulfotelmatobacter sp.]
MDSVVELGSPGHTRQIRQVQVFTIAWMLAEAVVSLFSAWRARSPALLAFGGDSVIELTSAVVVLWRFRSSASCETKEGRAARIAGALLFVLAACVVVVSAVSLLGYGEPKPSVSGIGILLLAAVVMPLLAREKRKLSRVTGSAALRADAAESAVCAYLSVVALLGVGLNTVWHISWADPVAALVIVPLIVWEGREAMSGKACSCH